MIDFADTTHEPPVKARHASPLPPQGDARPLPQQGNAARLQQFADAGLLMDEATLRSLLAETGTSTVTVREFKLDWQLGNEALATGAAQADLALRALDAASVRVQELRIQQGVVVLVLAEPPPMALVGAQYCARDAQGRMWSHGWFRCCWLQWATPNVPVLTSREAVLIHSLRYELERALRDAWTNPAYWPAEARALLEATAEV